MSRRASRGMSSALPIAIGFATVLALVGGFGAWAALAQIDGAVLAPGRIVVERNRQAVQHPEGGVVEEILVKEGDRVEAEQLLARLDPTLIRSELRIVEGQLFELMARRGRLEAERDGAAAVAFDPVLVRAAARDVNAAQLMEGQRRLFEARLETLEKSVVQLINQRLQLENQIEGIDAQRAALDRQLAIIAQETQVQQELLDKGLAQTSRVLNLQREDARLAGLMGELTARRAQAMERIAELEIEELQLHARRREDAISVLRDLQFNEMEMAERRQTFLTQLDRLEVRAPVAGVVYDLRILGARSVVRPADPMLFIVPRDRPLVIEARIDPIDVNKVFASREVALRFRAFDLRDTPDLLGQVTQVSPDAFTDEQTGRPFYRAEIILPEAELAKLDAGQVLIPGMPVDTFIRTGEHTPLTYLTAPLVHYFEKALRDNG